MSQKLLIVFLCYIGMLITPAIKCELNPEHVVIAINCGGDEYRDPKGVMYEKDTYFEGGQTSDFGSNFDIKLTPDQELYQTERWSAEDFTYQIPVSQAGKHILVLKFSEVYFNSPAEKTFDVSIGNKKVLTNLDIFSKVGKATAYDEHIELDFRNNKVYINNKLAEGGYNEETGVLNVTFIKGGRDNPKINAILLVKGTLAETDYEYYKGQLEEMERQKMERERKQREFQKKSIDYDYEDFEDDYIESTSGTENGFTLLSPTTLILVALGTYFMYRLFLKKSPDPVDEY